MVLFVIVWGQGMGMMGGFGMRRARGWVGEFGVGGEKKRGGGSAREGFRVVRFVGFWLK